ncbi:hypothetical protein AMAG_13533 [Allomyces macrogynus ATCC 38327]|uniref:NADH:flavin oxidoreductase/NADH oxidase N-terminal domain-containing protein n=1 Tax=Allomyces macrogynus (strain ATCC 38327) TaxID=578462 RepID=A0A0L0T2L3_ALLM3|nr:hypothetical protein AMAG_13533 [Allomyces macrogynus ATCC 38327]|eukprot:KNE68895.1 hypothetical protein AMAG_13533 [Allomyces macrogynus ATCC 38327]
MAAHLFRLLTIRNVTFANHVFFAQRGVGFAIDEHIESLKRTVDYSHVYNGKIGIQFVHTGCKALTYPLFEKDAIHKEVTVKQIQDTVTAFSAVADRADRAGHDMLEIQDTHGYLIHQVLSPVSNQCTDD